MKIKALAILVLGIVLMVLAFVIFSGGTDVVTIDANKLNSDANGQLVYVQGQLKPRGALEDQLFGISERDAIGLKRIVELYQYQQSESGDPVTVWSDEIITLDNPSNSQPLTKWVESVAFSPNEYELGVYNLSASLQGKVTASNWEPMPFTPEQYNALPSSGKRAFKLYEGKLYYGINPEQPRIGDMFISFERAIQNVTIVAQLSGGQLIPDTETGNNINVIRNGSVSKDALIENLDLAGGLIRLIVLGVGFIVTLLGGFLFIKSRGSNAHEADDNEFAELDSEEFSADSGLQEDLSDESDIPENLDEPSQPLPEDLGNMAAEIASGAGIHSSHDDGSEHYAPMKTPGMEEDQHDDITPLDNTESDTSFSAQEAPEHQAQVDDSESLSFEEPAIQEPQQEEHFAVDDIDGLDFDLSDDTTSSEPIAAEPSVESAETINQLSNNDEMVEPVSDDFVTNFEVETAQKEVSEDSSWMEDDAQVDSTLDISADNNGVVEPLSEDGFENQSYEDDMDISDEMFLLDDEQDEGGSEPQEVDSADAVASTHTEFEPSVNQEDDLSEIETNYTESNAEQSLQADFATNMDADPVEVGEMPNNNENTDDELDDSLNLESTVPPEENDENQIAAENNASKDTDEDQDEDDDDFLFLDDDDDDDNFLLDDEDEEDEDDDDFSLEDDDDDEEFLLDDEDDEVILDDNDSSVDAQPIVNNTSNEEASAALTTSESDSLDDDGDEFDGDWDFDDIQAVDDSAEGDDSNKKNKDNSAVDIQEF